MRAVEIKRKNCHVRLCGVGPEEILLICSQVRHKVCLLYARWLGPMWLLLPDIHGVASDHKCHADVDDAVNLTI